MAIIDLSLERKAQGNFIEEYINFTKKQESPEDFHRWVAISIIATALGRKVWLDQGYYKIYPNLYIILVGESAIVHKSSAANIGDRVLREALGDTINVVSQKISPEAFINYLSKLSKKTQRADALMFVSEFATFLGKSHLDPTLMQILTDYYDSPAHRSYTTLTRGVEEIDNICLNMLACTTPDWLKNSLPEESIGGGFYSRLITVNRTESREPNPHPGDNINEDVFFMRNNCINDLKVIQTLQGPFKWSKEAKTLYSTWYCDYLKRELEESPIQLRGYYGRKGDHLIKVAMIFSAAESSSMIISDWHLGHAMKALQSNEEFMKGVVDKMGTTETGRTLGDIERFVKKYTMLLPDDKLMGVSHARLLRNFAHKYRADELVPMMDSLSQAGLVEIKRIQGTGKKTTTFYTYIGDKK